MNTQFQTGNNVRLIKGLEPHQKYDGVIMRESMFFAGAKRIEEFRNLTCRIGIYYYPYSVLERVGI